jgi:AraC-like DNA-binding protein
VSSSIIVLRASELLDPLAQIVDLLRPDLSFAKYVEAAGAWRVDRREDGRAFFVAPLQGAIRLAVEGDKPLLLGEGDFALIPAAHRYAAWNADADAPAGPEFLPAEISPGVFRLGDPAVAADVRMLVGYCRFASNDTALVVSLLPATIVARGAHRLGNLIGMAADELRAGRVAGDAVVARLMGVVLIEALRSSGAQEAAGVLRGLGDPRIAPAIRAVHDQPTAPWSVPGLARIAAMSRSSFFDQFRRAVGMAPMEYLLHWRMALAKRMLDDGAEPIARIAERVGYASTATFSTAFSRHVGISPRAYTKRQVA